MPLPLPLGLTEVESPAFVEIYKLFKANLSIRPEMKDLVFCVAYTHYKRKKLETGNRLKGNGVSAKTTCQNINKIMNDPTSYKDILSEAKNKVTDIADVAGRDVLAKLSGIFMQNVTQALRDYRPPAPVRKSPWRRVASFFLHSAEHALHIVIAALILLAMAVLLRAAQEPLPVLANFLEYLGLKYFERN